MDRWGISMKLFLYSFNVVDKQLTALTRLVGKKPKGITVACIENAADVVGPLKDRLPGFRTPLQEHGYQLEQVDLRDWQSKRERLREKLESKDVIWLGGGNTFYLRWLLRETGADEIITGLVRNGKVYAGWSAGAIVAGPTLRYFDGMEDMKSVPEVIRDGLNLIDVVVVPHRDNDMFAKAAHEANESLSQVGFSTVFLADDQVYVVNGDERKVL